MSTPRSTGLIFGVLAVSLGSLTLLQSLVVPVLPTLQREFSTSPSTVTWTLTAWLIAAAIATPLLGKVGDMIGKRRTLLLVLAAIIAGSLVAAAAPTIEVLLAGRVLQGVGGALFPLAFGIVRDTFPASRVPSAIGALSAIIAVGSGLGTILAGPIVDALGWRGLFLIPAAVMTVAGILTFRVIPESQSRPGGRINWLAAALLSGWLVALLLPLSEGMVWGWGSPVVVGLFAASAVLLATWIIVEAWSDNPLIDMRLMRRPIVWTVNLTALLVGAGMFGVFAFFPRFAQTPTAAGYGFGDTVTASGLLMVPMLVTMAIVGFVSGPLARVIGFKSQLVGGSALIALSAFGFAFLHGEAWQVSVEGALTGLGLGFAYAAMTSLIVQGVPVTQTGVASGMNANLRTIGGAIGSTVMAAIVTSSLQPDGLPQESGYTDGYLTLALLLVGATLVALLVPSVRRRRGSDDALLIESPYLEAEAA